MDRKELKATAKAAFKANYWKCVLVSFIMSLLVGGTVSSSASTTTNAAVDGTGSSNVNELIILIKNNKEVAIAVASIIFGTIAVVMLIATLIDAFLINPLKMGGSAFYLKNTDDSDAKVDEMTRGFKPAYKRNVVALFLKDLIVGLLSLLLIVPGVIKSLSYKLVPYILAQDDEISAKDALKKSTELMKGHKWEAFVLGLSFIPWILFGIVTLGFGMLLYVEPYMDATDAEYCKRIING